MITKDELSNYLADYQNFSAEEKANTLSYLDNNEDLLLELAADSHCKTLCEQILELGQLYYKKISTDKNFVNQLDISSKINLLASVPQLQQQFQQKNSFNPQNTSENKASSVDKKSNATGRRNAKGSSIFSNKIESLRNLTSFKGENRPISKKKLLNRF